MVRDVPFIRGGFASHVLACWGVKLLFHLMTTLVVIGVTTECFLVVEEFLGGTLLMPCTLTPVFSLGLIEVIHRVILLGRVRSRSAPNSKFFEAWEWLFIDKLLHCRIAALSEEAIRPAILRLVDIIKISLWLSVYCLVTTDNLASDRLVLLEEVLIGARLAHLAIILLIQSGLFVEIIL